MFGRSYFGNTYYGGTYWGHGTSTPTSTTDTHDGWKREDEVPGFDEPVEQKIRKDALRSTIRIALEGPAPEQAAIAQEAITPYLEAGTPLVASAPALDWEAIMRDASAQVRLEAAAAEQQRILRIMRDDDEVMRLT